MIWIGLLFVWACVSDAPLKPTKRSGSIDVMLVTVDGIRADRIGAYGDPFSQTPHLDALAKRSLLYREAHTVSPDRIVAHAALMSGTLPAFNGLRQGRLDRLSDEIQPLASVFQAANYNTGAFLNASDLGGHGLLKGFGRVSESPLEQRTAAQVISEAVDWWEKVAGPRMAWVQISGGLPKQNIEGTDLYRERISSIDSLIGQLIDVAGPGALIVVVSTSGESLWESGERGHGVFLHRGVTRIPWILHPPNGLEGSGSLLTRRGVSKYQRPKNLDQGLNLEVVTDAPNAARVVEASVSLIDVAPTITDFVGLDWRTGGRSRRPPVSASSAFAYAENTALPNRYGWSSMFMIQKDERRIEKSVGLRSYLWRDNRQTTPHLALLKDLEVFSGNSLPVSGIDSLDIQSDVLALSMADILSVSAAAEVLKKQLPSAKGPAIPLRLAEIDLELNQPLSALQRAKALLDVYPGFLKPALVASMAAFDLGLYSQSEAFANQVLKSKGLAHKAHRLRIESLLHLKQSNRVHKACIEALSQFPDDAEFQRIMGDSLSLRGEYSEALKRFQAAQGRVENPLNLEFSIAETLLRLSKIDEALIRYDRAAAQRPQDIKSMVRFVSLLLESNQCHAGLQRLNALKERGFDLPRSLLTAMNTCIQRP